MPEVSLEFFMSGDRVPVLEWLRDLKLKNYNAFVDGVAALMDLKKRGHDIERPQGGYLGDDVYELRWKSNRTHFRILYLFHKRHIVVLANAFSKDTRDVPPEEKKRALRRMALYQGDPRAHAFRLEIENV
jgi:phage-related protein